jgi:hypothetical protein
MVWLVIEIFEYESYKSVNHSTPIEKTRLNLSFYFLFKINYLDEVIWLGSTCVFKFWVI